MKLVPNTIIGLALALNLACSARQPTKPAPPDTQPSPSAARTADPSAFIASCIAAGLPTDGCQCSGVLAANQLGATLLDKMAAAPADEDPALPAYYEAREVQTIMDWVEVASGTCGLEPTP